MSLVCSIFIFLDFLFHSVECWVIWKSAKNNFNNTCRLESATRFVHPTRISMVRCVLGHTHSGDGWVTFFLGTQPLPTHFFGIWVYGYGYGYGYYVNIAQTRMRHKIFTTWVRMSASEDDDHITDQSIADDLIPLSLNSIFLIRVQHQMIWFLSLNC